ncbi:MAG: mechanosensitive ion channel family protein [bacterium]
MKDWLMANATSWGVKIGLALAILIIGRWVSSILVRVLSKILTRTGMDEMLVRFVSSIARTLLLLVVIIASLDQLGVDTTSLVALVGAAGLAVGLALQNSLQNFASGVMLIVFRPFKTNDLVEAGGVTGVVEQINIFSTTMRTGDNKEMIVPNGDIFSGTITNFSARKTRRVDMVFGIAYDDDLKKAKAILVEMLEADERILKDPAPLVVVGELADASVNFFVRPWVNAADYWKVYFDMHEQVKLRFDAEGISIPYPQMDVHVHQNQNDAG